MTLLIVALVAWLAQSGIEYKVVSSYPRLKPHFQGTKGMVISLVISTVVTLAVGSTMGVEWAGAFALAGLVGLFTNEFTYKLFDTINRANRWTKDSKARVTEFKTKHPRQYEDLKLGAKGTISGIGYGFMFIGKLIRFVGWTFSLPSKIHRRFSRKGALS